jgi:hypothetical protein
MSALLRVFVPGAACAWAYAALAIGCGEDDARPSAGDAGAETTSVESGSDAPTARSEPCSPESTTPPARPHWPATHRSECADRELVRAVIECAFALKAAETCASQRGEATWAPCERCIFGGPEGAPATDAGADAFYATPLIVEQGIARVDVGACLELAAGGDGGTRCISDFRRSHDCVAAACVQCASRGSGAYDECRALADQSTCKNLVAPACGLELVDAGCDVSNNFIDTAVRFAQNFCL